MAVGIGGSGGFGGQGNPQDQGRDPSRDVLQRKLQSEVLSTQERATQTFDEFYEDSVLVQNIRDRADDLLGNIDEQMATITSQAAEASIDTEGLVGQVTETFDATKNQILGAANASARKASFELDAYLGSAGSDARSSVRRNMASQVTTELMSKTQQNLATLYGGFTQNVVDVTLKGAQVNAQVTQGAASAIASLTNSAANVMLGANAAIIDGYVKTVSVANDLFKTQAELLSSIYGMESAEYRTALGQATRVDPLYIGPSSRSESFFRENPSGFNIPGFGFVAD